MQVGQGESEKVMQAREEVMQVWDAIFGLQHSHTEQNSVTIGCIKFF